MKEVKLTVEKKPKTFSLEIPTDLTVDDVIGALELMVCLLDFMKENKPTVEMHEYHVPQNYLDCLNINTTIDRALKVLWQLSYKYHRKGKSGYSSGGCAIFTGSGYNITENGKDSWVTTMFSDSLREFLDGKVDIEGMFKLSKKEMDKWLEQNEPYKP